MPSRSQRPPSDPWRELALALKLEEPTQLADTVARLAPALGLGHVDIGGRELRRRLESMLAEERLRRRDEQLELRLQRARVAAEIASSKPVGDGRVVLDLDLLNELCAHPSARFLGFALGEAPPVIVPVHRLRAACRFLKSYADLHAWVDDDALRLRWRDGRGGLNFRYQHAVSREDRRRTFMVALGATAPTVAVPQRRRRPAWLGDVLADLGFVI